MNILKLAGSGFLMGLADLIPGISGGTVAFILGIWERLILSISMLGNPFWQQAHRKNCINALKFLLPLISGSALAIFLFTKAVDGLLNSPFERVCLYNAFMGLILASCVLCLRSLKTWSLSNAFLFCVSIMAAFFVTNTRPSGSLYDIPIELLSIENMNHTISNIDFEKKMMTDVRETTLQALMNKEILKSSDVVFDKNGSQHKLSTLALKKQKFAIDPWIVFCGGAAICAMLLPGISGSYLLVILGMYADVIGNTADWIGALKSGRFDQDSFFFLMQFALGIVLGAFIFSKVIAHIFKRFHDKAMACLAGFVLGSLKAVWPFWTYAWILDPLKLERGARLIPKTALWGSDEISWTASLWIVLAGFLCVFVIEYLANRKRVVKNSV